MAGAAELCIGRWVQDASKSENVDNYFKMIGLSMPLRFLAKKIKITLEFSIDSDGLWTMKNINTFKSKDTVFKIGEKFEDTTIDGKHTKNLITLDGNKLIFVSNGYCEYEVTAVMDFYEDSLVETMKANGVVATRKYVRERKN